MRGKSISMTGCVAAAAVLLATAAILPVEAFGQYFRFGKNRVQYEAQEWFYLQSTHFDVFYYDDAYELADFTAKAAEDAYRQISGLFRYEITDRIPIIVYKSHNDFAVTNAVDLPAYSEGIGGVTELFKNRVAIPFMGDYRDYRRVLHHELVHAVINDMFYGGTLQSILQNNIRLRIPDWFNEGLAEYAALGWDTSSDMYIRDAVLEDNLPPIQHLRGYFAYRGGQSVWDYIASQYGREKISEILQRARLSRSIEGSLERSTGLSFDELSRRWQQSLREIHYPELTAREDLGRTTRPRISRREGYLNSSPALSPQGDRLAYVSTRGAFFDVYIANVNEGGAVRRLVNGQDNSDFESLRILSPGLTWSPDGRQIALAVKSRHSEAIAVVDVGSGEARHYRTPEVDQIFSVTWNPRGHSIAFSGAKNGQSDIYVLDLGTSEIRNLTQDAFSDHEPSWRHDGRAIAFHSDRGRLTEIRKHGLRTLDMFEHDFGRYDVYLLELDEHGAPLSSAVHRVTSGSTWDNMSARFGPDPHRLLFVSDRNGIYNLYEADLETGSERPLTDVVRGITQVALSGDGQRAAVVSLEAGVPSIYILNEPFERTLERDELRPNVWAQRVDPRGDHSAPAVAMASATVREGNPFIRAASDGYGMLRWQERLAELRIFDEIDGKRSVVGQDSAVARPGRSDTTAYGGVRVDFTNYVFDESYEDVARERGMRDRRRFTSRFEPEGHLDDEGSFREQRYRLRFSPDIVYGAAGYDVLYGVQGVTQMMFSDMLGNHQIFVATNLLIDLRNSDYVITYAYLPNRIDWSVSSYHMSRLLPDFNRLTYYRYRQYGASVAASYPLDKFRRVDSEIYLLGVSQIDIGDPASPTANKLLLYPSLTYTADYSTPGMMYPVGGRRMALNVSGSPVGFRGGSGEFVTFLGDGRYYTSFSRGSYALAFRVSAGASFGPGQQLFFSSGTQNWINRRFDSERGFPIDDVSDFVFARPVMPLRGFDINTASGSQFGLLNAEFRFPLVRALLPGPLPMLPIHNLQGTAFIDSGVIWGGDAASRRLRIVSRDDELGRRFDDLMVGAGVGLRSILLGFPIRFDWAWPFDGHSFGPNRFYFSVGLDF
jgi:Tol biopolymer transport system component